MTLGRFGWLCLLLTWICLGRDAHAGNPDNAEQAIASWVPPSILVTVVALLGGAWWKSFTRRLDKIETTMEAIKERLPGFVTNDQLGRLGDRMDGRITNLSSVIEVVKDRLSRRGDRGSDE